MSALSELQAEFADAVFADAESAAATAALLRHCADPHGLAARGIVAYRQSVLANLAVAVRATYPLLEQIVGTPLLAACARRYAHERPSRSGNLNRYGADFGEFIAAAAPELPYLAEVARLEWAIQQVDSAADAPAGDLDAFASTPPESWGDLRCALVPAHALLASRWPLARIWRVHQADWQGELAIDFSHGEDVLILRGAHGIEVSALVAGERELLASLAVGNTLNAAVAAALARDRDFDLQAALARHLGNGLLNRVLAPESRP